MKTRSTLMVSALVLAALCGRSSGQSDLAAGFLNPPDRSKPHTWWHWMNGNITRDGITADLEAMKKIGLGGAQIFNVSESIPDGPVKIMSPEWLELVKFAASEADRVGLELCMHNCSGWSSSGGPWITPDLAMQKVISAEVAVKGPQHYAAELPLPPANEGFYRDIAVLAFPTPKDGAARVKDIGVKAGFDYRYGQDPAADAVPEAGIISREKIVDLTERVSNGKLEWDVPEGSWTIVRMGHTPTGARNAPSPASGRGLECDKFSREALDAHWAGMMGPVVEALGPLAGKTLNNCLIDSYEMGGQNWTPKFREEFQKRRGYDPLAFLPAISGRIIDSGEVTERFLWDFRRTIADLFADNYYSHFAEICRSNGLQASIEPYDGPFECLLSGRDADIPMGEFWVGGGESNSCKLAASVGHTYGRTIVGAESFTAEPSVGKWQNDPASLKSVGDLMYTVGINRYIIHRYAHQPWMDKFPGMTMGQWGTHFERTTTWWNQGSAWISYLARCQYLLQQGLFAADVCYFPGDDAPNDAPLNLAIKAAGYDYDTCNADVLQRRAGVTDGRLVLSDGMSYRVLCLPDSRYMTPGTLTRIRDLVRAGLTVIGPKPAKSPSLADYPACDTQVAALADEIWGDADGDKVKEHALGNGRAIWGKTPDRVLADAGVRPDCQFEGATGKLAWIHRTAGDTDIYFLSNQMPRSQEVKCTFRISGRAPELWHADTGTMEPAAMWSSQAGLTSVPIRFEGSGSVFVVFRKAAGEGAHLVAVKSVPSRAEPVHVPKIEIRKAVYEATDGAGGVDVTGKVAAMVRTGQLTIPATNSAFGDPAYNHVKRLRLEYAVDGKSQSRTAAENASIELVELPPDVPATFAVHASGSGPELWASLPGVYEFSRSTDARTIRAEVKSVPAAAAVAGPWSVTFPPHWGAPPSATFESLISWTDHADAGIKYFSGTAEYEKQIDIPAELVGPGRSLVLDLGRVKNIAEVSLNGKDLGILWKPPFAVDISGLARAGANTLKVRVTNLWVNRLVGDEQLPEDVEWNGKPIKRWPQWMVDGTPRPSKDRLTFTTWHHFTKDSQPLESGLIGPVMLRPAARVPIDVKGGS